MCSTNFNNFNINLVFRTVCLKHVYGYWITILLMIAFSHSYDSPPRITRHPDHEIGYKLGEETVIPCEAVGPPTPSYEWKKNDQPLPIDGRDIRFTGEGGGISIQRPNASSEGVYQCFARNELGRSVSVKTTFKMAVLEPFPTLKQPKIVRPLLGTSLTLRCNPPRSYPPGLLYWGEHRSLSKLKPIENTKRVSLDYDGHLHFSNIVANDSRGGLQYVCIVQNTVLRSIMQGDDQLVEPNTIAGEARYAAPKLMWSSPTNQVALKDQSVKMKCIFSGFPAPDVTWTRLGKPMPPSADPTSSFGQELIISSPQFDDEGKYRCSANNTQTGTPEYHEIQLTVEALPNWRSGSAQENVIVEEDDTAHIECMADGQPKPTTQWYSNGVPLQDLPSDTRLSVAGGVLELRHVSKRDVQVFQCNASNVHGYILANVHLNVLAEPPTFTKTLDPVTKVTVGKTVRLPCQVFGTKPVVSWSTPRESKDHEKQKNGDLVITNTQLEDSGKYTCNVKNKYGEDFVYGELQVRDKTQITKLPMDQHVNVSSDVTFQCGVTSDPREEASLIVEWRRNGQTINLKKDGARYYIDSKDNSLTVRSVTVADTSIYTCHADNGVDAAEASASLVVKDRPDPPYGVHVVECLGKEARAHVRWSRGSDNNDKIIEYIIRAKDLQDNSEEKEIDRVNGNLTETVLQLMPWVEYKFSVVARNRLGESQPGTSSSGVCKTLPREPSRHPDGVCTDTTRGGTLLVIKWKPISKEERFGPGFRYVIRYRTQGLISSEKSERISDWRRSELIISNQPTYQKYEISVSVENDKGPAEGRTPNWVPGYSGQGVPQIKLKNFVMISTSLNSTYCEFGWTPVDRSTPGINGFFRGYRIQFWRSSNPDDVRHEDFILNHEVPCPLNERLVKRSEESVGEDSQILEHNDARFRIRRQEYMRGGTNKLWPYSRITAGILVLNGAHVGALSDTIEIFTPEGVPGPVAGVGTSEKGSNHLMVEWQPPREVNGVLKDYIITVETDGEEPKTFIVDDPNQTKKKIDGLKSDTEYKVKVTPRTGAGPGAEKLITDKTLPASAPSKPSVSDYRVGDESVLVTWDPVKPVSSGSNALHQQPNPGSAFYIEYRPQGTDEWKRTTREGEGGRSINVTGLVPLSTYEMRVVAVNEENGVERKTESEPVIIYIGPKVEPARAVVALQKLLFIVFCIFALLLLLILIIICCIRCNQGQKYFVQKCERKRGYGTRKDDDPAFDEYTRQQEPMVNKVITSPSLDSLEKPAVESDVDSLEDYADPDPGRFNEDGSFIGQYGIKDPAQTQAQDRTQQTQVQTQTQDQNKQTPGVQATAFTTLV